MIRSAAALAVFTTVAYGGELAKKDRELAAKTTKHPAPPKPGARPVALINIFNDHTREWLAVDSTSLPTNADGFLRDHYTNQATRMEPRLIGIVAAAARHFHSDVVDVVSAYRHPKYNLMLRKKGHQVARDSQHSHGDAIDFYIPHVATSALHAWAKAQKLGGVGLYLESAFVHMDTGPIRFWSGD